MLQLSTECVRASADDQHAERIILTIRQLRTAGLNLATVATCLNEIGLQTELGVNGRGFTRWDVQEWDGMPTPTEIRALAARVQAGWSLHEEQKRIVSPPAPAELPEVQFAAIYPMRRSSLRTVHQERKGGAA